MLSRKRRPCQDGSASRSGLSGRGSRRGWRAVLRGFVRDAYLAVRAHTELAANDESGAMRRRLERQWHVIPDERIVGRFGLFGRRSPVKQTIRGSRNPVIFQAWAPGNGCERGDQIAIIARLMFQGRAIRPDVVEELKVGAVIPLDHAAAKRVIAPRNPLAPHGRDSGEIWPSATYGKVTGMLPHTLWSRPLSRQVPSI